MQFQVIEPFDERGRSPALQRYERARYLMKAGAFEDAAFLFLDASAEEPHFKTFELLGECYMRMARPTQAIPFLAAASRLKQGVRAPSLLAEAWMALGQHTEAVEAADIALLRDPKNKAALRVRQLATPIIER